MVAIEDPFFIDLQEDFDQGTSAVLGYRLDPVSKAADERLVATNTLRRRAVATLEPFGICGKEATIFSLVVAENFSRLGAVGSLGKLTFVNRGRSWPFETLGFLRVFRSG
jgi:hypothetical protein